MPAVRIGVSSCLLGRPVRWDGGDKRDAFLTDTLAQVFELVAVCPEVEVGMGVPRDSVRLVGRGAATRMIAPRTGRDFTAEMSAWAEARVRGLAAEELSGYVLKKSSPSCGLEGVKTYDAPDAEAPASLAGVGLFAAALRRRLPDLPVVEETALGDPAARGAFVERVLAYHRVRALFRGRWTLARLVAFHTAHKLLLLSHDTDAYRALGRLVARARALPRAEVAARYTGALLAALAKPATRGRHENVLLHVLGYMRRRLDAPARHALLELIASYRRGDVPLAAPLGELRRHARELGVSYLTGQLYLEPGPLEGALPGQPGGG